jgi:uncharacterized delta-60 repeat protein
MGSKDPGAMRVQRLRRSAAVAVLCGLVGAVLAIAPAAAAPAPPGAAGALDPTFGSGGVASITIPNLAVTAVSRALVQPDGKIVVAGIKKGSANAVVLVRLNVDGTLDTTFGAAHTGWVQTEVGTGRADDGAQIALDPRNGRIVVAGGYTTTAKSWVERWLPNGTRDTSWDGDGKAYIVVSGTPLVRATGLVVEPDGKVVTSVWAGSSGNFTLVRFTADGKADTTFGSKGIAQTTTAGGPVLANDVARTTDGKYVVVGSAKINSKLDTAVARFTAAGQPDTTFPTTGSNGTVRFDVAANADDVPEQVNLDSAGRIVISGTISSSKQAYVLRLSSAGVRDATFGANGLLTTTFGGATATGAGTALDGAGRILLAGGDGPSAGTNAIGLARLLATGTSPLDATFANGGKLSLPCPSGQTGAGSAVAVQPNQQMLLVGSCNGVL